MTQHIRTFIGIPVEPTEPLRRSLDELHTMGRGIKPVAAHSMHITLKFVGDTPQDRVARLSELIQQSIAANQPAIDVKLRGLDAFPNRQRPSILWAALVGAEQLVEIAESLNRLFEPEGFAREGRTYTPHLTMARVRAQRQGSRSVIPERVLDLLDEHRETDFGSIRVGEVVFYQSVLKDSGPIYTRLITVPLD